MAMPRPFSKKVGNRVDGMAASILRVMPPRGGGEDSGGADVRMGPPTAAIIGGRMLRGFLPSDLPSKMLD